MCDMFGSQLPSIRELQVLLLSFRTEVCVFSTLSPRAAFCGDSYIVVYVNPAHAFAAT